MCPFQLGREYCLGRGRVWQGLSGQWAQACPSGSFSDLSLLFGACPFCSCLSARWRELRLSGKDGKPRACVNPGFLPSPKGGYPVVLVSRGVAVPDSSLCP